MMSMNGVSPQTINCICLISRNRQVQLTSYIQMLHKSIQKFIPWPQGRRKYFLLTLLGKDFYFYRLTTLMSTWTIFISFLLTCVDLPVINCMCRTMSTLCTYALWMITFFFIEWRLFFIYFRLLHSSNFLRDPMSHPGHTMLS